MRWLGCPNCGFRVPRRPGFRYCPLDGAPLRAPERWLWRWRQRVWPAGRLLAGLGAGMERLVRMARAALGQLGQAVPLSRAAALGGLLVLAALGLVFWRSSWKPPGGQPLVPDSAVLLYRSGSGIHEVPFGSGQAVVLSSGQDYRIRVRPGQPYLYVLQQQGQTYWRLFPHRVWTPGANPVPVGTDQVLPSERSWYCLDETPGEETIHVVSSASPLPELEQVPEAPGAGARLENLERLVRDRRWSRYSFRHAAGTGGCQ